MVHTEIVVALYKYHILTLLILRGISNISLHDALEVVYTLVLMVTTAVSIYS